LLAPDELSSAAAEAYLAYDDAGWVMLGLGGVSIGVMIIGVSLASLELGMLPRWAGWLGVAFGVVSFATITAIGIFAWTAWLIIAGVLMLVPRQGSAPVTAGRELA
jgi:hypothetical protein